MGNVGGKTGNVGGDGSEIQASGFITLSGGTPTIAKSKNVASITDRGTGAFTMNLTNNLPSLNYVLAGSSIHRITIHDDTVGISRAIGTIPIRTNLDNGVGTDGNFSFMVTGG